MEKTKFSIFKFISSVILGLLSIGVVFIVVKLIVSLLIVLLFKLVEALGVLSFLFSLNDIAKDACPDPIAAIAAFSCGRFIMEKICGQQLRTFKASLCTAGIATLSLQIFSVVIIIISWIIKLDYDGALITNIVQILGAIWLIKESKEISITNNDSI